MHPHRHLAALTPRLPRRTVRLTALYGGLFLLSCAGLLAITITIVLASGWPPASGADQSFGIEGQSRPGEAGSPPPSTARIHQIAAGRRPRPPTSTPPRSTICWPPQASRWAR